MFDATLLAGESLFTGALGYGVAAVVYLILALLVAKNWGGRMQGGLLLAACCVSIVWAFSLALHAAHGHPYSTGIFVLELLRDGLWIWFILCLLTPEAGENSNPHIRKKLQAVGYGVVALLFIMLLAYLWKWFLGGEFKLFGHLLLAIIGLVLIEQVFRNTPPQQRWAIKFLCLGVGGGFAYDFYLYSDAVLFGRLDIYLWDARGFVQTLIVPLIGVSASRNPQWSLDVFVSRRVAFHSVVILVVGSYLLIMALGGYYIRYWGGEWGVVAQVFFLFSTVVILLMSLFSEQLRAQFKVFFNKHFSSAQYDYRQEWLNLTDMLSNESRGTQLQTLVIQALAGFVDSKSGLLWLCSENGIYALRGVWGAPKMSMNLGANDPLVSFIEKSKWIIDLDEYRGSPEKYEGLEIPEWLTELQLAWLVVPLIQHERLFGFAILGRSQVSRSLNWEDRDLLKTAGSQAAGYLALLEANEALVDSRQFEAFNRLSAYVVHDLKNVVGQLSLVAENAKKFRENPEFVDDAFATVENAVAKMQRMLAQLRVDRKSMSKVAIAVRLESVLNEVVRQRQAVSPHPVIEQSEVLHVVADRDRLASVIEHVVSNAQEATPDDGRVVVRLKRIAEYAVLEVEDTGCGMDFQFVQERLFRPFDTTKGNAGMGVGVYECREFVRSLGGDVEVESRVGKGTLFRLNIPLQIGQKIT